MDPIVAIVIALLGGGLLGGLASFIVGRATARKTNSEAAAVDAKLPAEVDSVVVQGAETAVLTMKQALDSATARIAQLEGEREADRKRIADLEAKVQRLQGKVDAAGRSLQAARREGAELRDEFSAFLREQDHRK